jgi:hypothetical protein
MQGTPKEVKQISRRISVPNGTFAGIWGGYVVHVPNAFGREFEIVTHEGIRSPGTKCFVTFKDNECVSIRTNGSLTESPVRRRPWEKYEEKRAAAALTCSKCGGVMGWAGGTDDDDICDRCYYKLIADAESDD